MNRHVPYAQLLRRVQWPLVVTLVLTMGGGWYLINRADAQARDTTRKHHLEDIEQALYFARNLHGVYPPYDQETWCGQLEAPKSAVTHDEIEEALRAQNEKYKNPEKPFPTDPHEGTDDFNYFYWKRSPVSFELYAQLEADQNNERSSRNCPTASPANYDYGITSVWREQ